MDVLETQKYIKKIKDFFQINLASTLNLTRVSAPLFVLRETGLNDQLNGYEKAIDFKIFEGKTAEIVHSLAKWKRFALNKYNFNTHTGLYTDMNAIRKDETVDNIHSYYVDQWDWEYIIEKEERTEEVLIQFVNKIYGVLLKTESYIHSEIPEIEMVLPERITFVTTQELEDMYPDLTAKERENEFTKEKGAVFVMKVGKKLNSGKPHDGRSPDYDDWELNGDILVWFDEINMALELSSMGIRVDKDSLIKQLEIAGATDRLTQDYHKMVINSELPFTIGGGIGQSRLCMYFLKKRHIGEVQASIWPDEIIKDCEARGIELL